MDFYSILLAMKLLGGGGGGKTLSSISAVYTQSGTVYDTDTLNSLKSDLVVTATYSDSSSETVTTYTLSGTLEAGTSTITVSYGGKTTTFNVTVTASSTLLYSLENQAVTDEGPAITTDIDLVSTDMDFTICVDASLTTKNGQYKIFYAWENGSPWRGPTLGTGGSNAFNAKYITSIKGLSNSASSLTSVKAVMVHSKGSGKAIFYYRLDGASTTSSQTVNDTFVSLTSSSAGLRFGYHNASNNWVGTINRAYVYSVALTSEQAEEFLTGD